MMNRIGFGNVIPSFDAKERKKKYQQKNKKKRKKQF